MRSWPPRWPETPVSAVGGDPPGRLPSGGKARENRPGSGVAHHWSSNAPNATADLVGGHERSTPEWPVSGAEPGCGPTLASNDAARPTLGVATTGGVARAGHDRTQRRARSLTIDVVGGAGVSCLLVFTFRGITSVARQRFSTRPAVLAGGERCVARTRSPGQRRGGHPLA
jgi:hypothetical protein